MATRVKVKLNSRGIDQLLHSAQVRALLRERANPIAARARSTAPVNTGDYWKSIGVEDATTDRAVVRVVARVAYALVIESKTGNLVRALGSEGG